jgi:hypothetical protein
MKHLGLVSIFCFLCLSAAAQVRFDADFESGNIGKVVQLRSPRSRGGVTHVYYRVGPHFDPENPIDTDLPANANWYYFRISGAARKYFHIAMPDNVVSGASYSYDGKDWFHLTSRESDRHNIFKRFTQDTVYIALYKPYNYSYLQERLQDWTARPFVTLDTIGFSHEGRPLQMLHITDPDVPAEQKARFWMHGRVHPSETPGSYLLDGLVDYLTSDTAEGEALRRQIDAYIVPFSNPDGVANGMSRSNALGVNEEINYGRPEDSTVVEVRAIKQMFEKLTAGRPLDFMLNCHSQLLETATFWMHRRDSTSNAYLRKQWAFTGLVCSQNPCIQPREMSFSFGGSRYPEGWIWNHFADSTMAITIETPYTCYSFDRSLPVDDDNLRGFGKRTMQAVAEYLGLSLPGRYVIETPDEPGEDWLPYQADDFSFIGNDAWMALSDSAAIEYALDSIPAGRYKLYRFEAGTCIQPDEDRTDLRLLRGGYLNPGTHGWVLIDTISQENSGPFRYTWQSTAPGSLADALLLVAE